MSTTTTTPADNIFPENAPDQFVPVPRWMYAARAEGKVSRLEFEVYSVLLEQADYATGIWYGAASRVIAALGGGGGERKVQDTINRELPRKGLVKSFHKQGSTHYYRVAIHGYKVRVGEHAGQMLDALSTTMNERGEVVPVYTSPQTSPQGKTDDNGNGSDSKGLDNKPHRTAHRTEDVTAASPSCSPSSSPSCSPLPGTGESRLQDSQDGQDRQERDRQENQHQPSTPPTAEGRMADSLASIYQKQTGKVCKPTKEEARDLLQAATWRVAYLSDAFEAFLTRRDKGLDGVFHPYRLFLSEADQWFHYVMRGNYDRARAEDITRLFRICGQRVDEEDVISLADQHGWETVNAAVDAGVPWQGKTYSDLVQLCQELDNYQAAQAAKGGAN